MAHVAIAGRFEPGAVVELYAVPEGHTRFAAGDFVDKRLADDDGTVGFDSLKAGDRFIAVSYNSGFHQEIQVRAKDEHEGQPLSQSPVKSSLMKHGLQESPVVEEPPATPAGGLETGIPHPSEPVTDQPDNFLSDHSEEATGTLTVEHDQGGIAGVDFARDDNPDT